MPGQAARPGRRYVRESRLRAVVVDIGAAASRRHVIPAWFDVDVTDVLPRLRGTARRVSLTVYVVATLARAVARHRRMHGYRDLRGRTAVFDDVDVDVSVEVDVEGESFPMNHVLRRAHARSPMDLDAELRAVAADPGRSETLRLASAVRWYVLLPAAVRSRLLGSMRRFPDTQKRLVGTVGVSSVGMYGGGGGVGLPFLVHTLDVLIGGLTERPGYGPDGEIGRRSFLSVAVVADHDVVDGAPLARFLAELRRDLESGAVLDA